MKDPGFALNLYSSSVSQYSPSSQFHGKERQSLPRPNNHKEGDMNRSLWKQTFEQSNVGIFKVLGLETGKALQLVLAYFPSSFGRCAVVKNCGLKLGRDWP